MILYKNILEKLKLAGYTTFRLRKEKLLSEQKIQAIREGKDITTSTIDAICKLLDCKVGDIIEFVPDEKSMNKRIGEMQKERESIMICAPKKRRATTENNEPYTEAEQVEDMIRLYKWRLEHNNMDSDSKKELSGKIKAAEEKLQQLLG